MRHLRILLLVIVLSTVVAGIARPVPAGGKILISTGEYAPWAGERLPHNGFMLHVVSSAFANAGYTVAYEFYPWARAYDMALVGRADATAYWFESEARRELCLYSDPLGEELLVYFFRGRDPVPDFRVLADLSGQRIAATVGYTYTDEFWKLAEDNLLDVEVTRSDETSFKLLLEGRVDVVMCSLVRGYKVLNDHYTPEVRASVRHHLEPLSVRTSHLLIPKRHKDAHKLLADFNQGLAQLRESGEYATMFDGLIRGEYSDPAARR